MHYFCCYRQNMPKEDRKLMEKYGKIMGYFEGSNPNLWITDTKMIKSIFVKDFDHFINRRVIFCYCFVKLIITLSEYLHR